MITILENMKWNGFIIQLLRDFRLSSSEFELKTGVSNVTVSNLKSGATKAPSQNTIRKIETSLNIKIDDSDPNNISYTKIASQDIHHKLSKFEGEIRVFEFPLFYAIYGEEKMSQVSSNDIANFAYQSSGKCFALQIPVSGIETTLHDGDIVLIDMGLVPKDGDMVAVLLKNGDQYVKRFKNLNQSYIQLSNDNGETGVRLIEKNDIEAMYRIVAVHLKV